MKISATTLRLLTGIGLAAGLFLGCQNILDQSADTSTPTTPAADQSALRLSIKDDSTCRDQWSAILAGRTSGNVDSAAEAGFLASCVKEVKPTDKGVPVVPPNLVPDSNTRCHWIVSQIEGGRDSMTVSYNRYCPDDCRKLEAVDSTRHEKLCHEPGREPGKGPGKDTMEIHGKDTLDIHGKDTTGASDKPRPRDDTCKLLLGKLNALKPGEAGRADAEHNFALRCKDPVLPPKDTSVTPPAHNPYEDTCRMIKAKLAATAPGTAGRADLEHLYAGLCKEWIPVDSLPKPPVDTLVKPPFPKPPIDTAKVPATPHDSVCIDLKLRLGASAPGTPGHADLEAAFKAKCLEPVPPVTPPATIDCDALRLKLSLLDPASVDYAHLMGSLKERCPDRPATP